MTDIHDIRTALAYGRSNDDIMPRDFWDGALSSLDAVERRLAGFIYEVEWLRKLARMLMRTATRNIKRAFDAEGREDVLRNDLTEATGLLARALTGADTDLERDIQAFRARSM